MGRLRRRARPISIAVAFGVLALSVQLPAARAAVIGTEVVIGAEQAQQDRARVLDLLNRQELQQRLIAAGADPRDVAARVHALTDDEVQRLAAHMDQLPAGGDALGALVFIFIVLLITDILGLTDVFPFVKKPPRR